MIPLPITVADSDLLASIRASANDATALQHIATARAEATIAIAHLCSEAREQLLKEQSRNGRLRVALDQQMKTAKEALAT